MTPPADHHTPKADAQQQWQWRKLGALGKGAYGSVCLGITHTGKLMAIKQVRRRGLLYAFLSLSSGCTP